MKKTSGSLFRVLLIFSDTIAIILSFLAAYLIRTNFDKRPYYFDYQPKHFLLTVCFLIPIWLIILSTLGLYKKSTILYDKRSKETARLFLASIIGTMTIISMDFFLEVNIFPVRIIALMSACLCFMFLIFFRFILRFIRRQRIIRSKGKNTNVVIVGNSKNTLHLSKSIIEFPDFGYKISGIVAGRKYIPEPLREKQYSSVKEAIKKIKPDIIFQTDENRIDYVYKQALNQHVDYYFVPSEAALFSQFGELELIGNTPAILVKTTPLIGDARAVKRFFDIFLSSIAIVLVAIPMLVIWVIVKLSDTKQSAFYSEYRLTIHNKRFKIYKFRSMNPEYSGMSPEKAFIKMGKPELIKKYRKNGDYLENDPRITKVGRILRRTSLDELPQLFNVLKGDISLVGPRALVPGELRNYGDRSLLLSVKSGLTGLAQVSGRRNIPFDERRTIDIFYVQNWSLWLDLKIILKTILVVFKHEGAK